MIKCCNRCGMDKPLTDFHRNKRLKDGRLNICKTCRRDDAVEDYAKNREQHLAAAADWRACNREHKLARDAAYRAVPEHREKQRQYNSEYYRIHRERLKARTADYNARDPKGKRERDAAYRNANQERLRAWHKENRIRNRDRLLERARDYYEQNKDQRREYDAAYRQRNKSRIREAVRVWHRANPDRVRLRRAMRRARSVPQVPFTPEQLRAKCAYWNDCCWICGDPATTIDHVKPLTAGGPHILANLRPACRSCNSRKRDKWPLPSRAAILGFVV